MTTQVNPFTRYLKRLNKDDPSLERDLAQIVHEVKQDEAAKINRKGIDLQIQYLHSQGWGYDEILMRMGCSIEEAQALIRADQLYPPRLQNMRHWLNRLASQGTPIGKLIDEKGRVVDVGFFTDMGPGFNRHHSEGKVLSCCKTRVTARDLLWLNDEPWWDTASTIRLIREAA